MRYMINLSRIECECRLNVAPRSSPLEKQLSQMPILSNPQPQKTTKEGTPTKNMRMPHLTQRPNAVLDDVLPGPAHQYVIDSSICYPVAIRQGLLRLFGLPDLTNHLDGKLAGLVARAYGLVRAALSFLILHVFQVVTQEEVMGRDAGRGIAFVENVGILWEVSIAQFPRNSMRSHHLEATADDAIPVRGCSGPEPASIFRRLVNLFPEALFECVWVGVWLLAHACPVG
jgi:hypothetical protein